MTDTATQGNPTALEAAVGVSDGTLRRRLVLLSLGALALLVALAATFAWRQYDAARGRALNEVRARVILAGSVFDTYFAGQISTLQAVAESPSVVSADEPAMRAYFERLQSQQEAALQRRDRLDRPQRDLARLEQSREQAGPQRRRPVILRAGRRDRDAVRERRAGGAPERAADHRHGGPLTRREGSHHRRRRRVSPPPAKQQQPFRDRPRLPGSGRARPQGRQPHVACARRVRGMPPCLPASDRTAEACSRIRAASRAPPGGSSPSRRRACRSGRP